MSDSRLALPDPLPDPGVLDHAIWSALTGPHAAFAQGDDLVRRYLPDVAPFCAVRPLEPDPPALLAARLHPKEMVALVTDGALEDAEGMATLTRAVLHQMVLSDPPALAGIPDLPLTALTAADVDQMQALVAATNPGPFARRTLELGNYLGIRIDGRLVAMGGERMKTPGFTEISAICVASDCRGRGYAAALIKRLATDILARSELPFLHVLESNASAIALYERLGFGFRRRFHLGVFEKAGEGLHS